MKLTSYGAADGVTGSCHLLEVGSKRLLLDCGMFQGGREQRERNEPPFPFDPSSIDVVLVSHAHLDHVGRLPLLWKEGFRGALVSTRATFELARLSLLDSASLNAADARRRNRRRRANEPQIEPLYDEDDVLNLVELWTSWAPYEEPRDVCEGVRVTFRDAGHILGSAFLEMELSEGEETKRLTFSGDLGNVNKPLINDPRRPNQTDVLLLESTYGDRDHRPFAASVVELVEAVNATLLRGGNCIVPTFALERAQELLYVLYEAWRDGEIPERTRIFLDSPMAISATAIFQRHEDLLDEHHARIIHEGGDPFRFPALEYTRATKDSIQINEYRSGCVILAGSGMVTGGRVLHHLRHNLMRPECSVIFPGFQASSTTGRKIVDGAQFVVLYGESIPVRAQVYTINGFSGHAGKTELTSWARESGAERIWLVHGEEDVKRRFATHLRQQTGANEVDVVGFGEARSL